MNEILSFLATIISGFFLGIIFFGGLWWTVRIGLESKNPATLFIMSFLVRTTSVMAGFYFLIDGHWERLVTSLMGFLIGKIIIIQFTKSSIKEASHAS